MNLRIVAQPTEEPISLNDAKDWLRVSGSDEDFLISALIVAARQNVENYLQRALISQTWELGLDGFPGSREIALPFPNLVSVASVKYYDEDNTLETLDSSNYFVDVTSLPGKVVLKPEYIWPATYDRSDAILIEYTCGYGDSSQIPENIKVGIKLYLAHLFEQRQIAAVGVNLVSVPMSVNWILSPYKYLTI
jgi:uncharacterized phiE125 gp8 family phage protein